MSQNHIVWIDNATNSANQLAGICDIIDSDHSILWHLMEPPFWSTCMSNLPYFSNLDCHFNFHHQKKSKIGPFLPKIHPKPNQILLNFGRRK